MMLDQNEHANSNKFTNQTLTTDRRVGHEAYQNSKAASSQSPLYPQQKVDTIGKLLETESHKRALMLNRGFYTGPLDSKQSYGGGADVAEDDESSDEEENDAGR